MDLVHTKKKGGESLSEFLQCWQILTTRISYTIPKHHLVKMFINNVHPILAHHMVMNCLQTYKDIKEKGMSLEQGLIKDGVIRLYKENIQDRGSNNEK